MYTDDVFIQKRWTTISILSLVQPAKAFLLLRGVSMLFIFIKEPNNRDWTLHYYSVSFLPLETNHIVAWWEVWFQTGSVSIWSDLNAQLKVTGPSSRGLWELQDTSYLRMDPKVPDLQTYIRQPFNLLSIRRALSEQGKTWFDLILFLFVLIGSILSAQASQYTGTAIRQFPSV